MKYLFVLLAVLALSGCASSPKVVPHGGNSYEAFGEAEMDYSSLIEDVHMRANKTCTEQGKTMRITDRHHGAGGVGFASRKRRYVLQFRCY